MEARRLPITAGTSAVEDNFAPIDREFDLADLPVIGALPDGLSGTLYRIGPNPQFAAPDANRHWFAGDGMIHAFTIRDGRACYRNRWVRTAKWRAERNAGRALTNGSGLGMPRQHLAFADEGVANTNIIRHGGRLLALEEGHLPVEIEPGTLGTRGPCDFQGALRGPFTAHPRHDPVTGDLLFFGYAADAPLSPRMSHGTISAQGEVTRFERFAAPYCSMVHDFAVTSAYVLFPILPLRGSRERARAGQLPYAWEPDLGSHLGLIKRACGVASLRWMEIPNRYAFHVMNAWDEGPLVIADVMEYEAPPLFPRADGSIPEARKTQARLVRWKLAPETGAFASIPLDDMMGEFPRIDERRAGLRNRYGFFAGRSRDEEQLGTLAWLDFDSGTRRAFAFPSEDAISEPVFAPRSATAPEGDGWILTVVWRGGEGRSDLAIFDTGDIAAGPIALVRLPHRVPFGFHGNWVSGAATAR